MDKKWVKGKNSVQEVFRCSFDNHINNRLIEQQIFLNLAHNTIDAKYSSG